MTIEQWQKIRDRIMEVLDSLNENFSLRIFYEDKGIFYLLDYDFSASVVARLKSELTQEFDQEFIVTITAMVPCHDGGYIINFEFTPIIADKAGIPAD